MSWHDEALKLAISAARHDKGLEMKILIVEDEPKTAAFIKRGFVEESFAADLAADGPDRLHLALTGVYDLIVLDVMLPKRQRP